VDRIALTIWNGKISPVFDVSRQLMVLDIEAGDISEEYMEKFASDDPVYRLNKLKALNVQTLICGAVSNYLVEILNSGGIKTISFISGNVSDVIRAYLADNLPNPGLTMPGCGGKQRRSRRRDRLTSR
jgi:predicted Fe-Mo cluster-binding NifX family protein